MIETQSNSFRKIHLHSIPFMSSKQTWSVEYPSPKSSKANIIVDFDASCKTADVDVSFRSACDFHPSEKPAKVMGDQSCLGGRFLRGSMKVQTQRDSLARIARASSSTSYHSLDLDLPPVLEGKSVRFDCVEFREYERGLCDNPSTSSGPPIGIGWRYGQDTIRLDLNLYETDREGCRRTKRELAIPALVREDMLREAGYSRSEINTTKRAAKKDKERRNKSFHQQKFDPLFETVDAVKHGMKRVTRRRSSPSNISQ